MKTRLRFQMVFPFLISIFDRLTDRWPILTYAAAWTTILTALVAVASFAPEAAFVWAINPNSSFSRPCGTGFGPDGLVRIPIDIPSEILCFPAHMFSRSKLDIMVPPIFAAVIVTASAFAVRAMGLCEVEEGLE
ncbi:uncharacterized protein LOC124909748 [Impatiens glandulifera]|uniref:uncharacterized protein LOC124909748 n=1 Tax=Impatiens glandulifera TaxID=253017 RepID=UPI001FB09464|nr:uncharacterized protein LOC124909748 [Impatiens glandulifera]